MTVLLQRVTFRPKFRFQGPLLFGGVFPRTLGLLRFAQARRHGADDGWRERLFCRGEWLSDW